MIECQVIFLGWEVVCLDSGSERGKDLQERIFILLGQICRVQRVKSSKPLPALAEFIVGFLEEEDS